MNGDPPKKNRPPLATRNPLTKEAIHDILTSSDTTSVLAKRYEKSPSSIIKVKKGELFPDVFPEIPRAKPKPSTRLSCHRCSYYVDRECKIGWPDLKEDGPFIAAKYCNDYDPKPKLESK